jgi:hypothetical protein
MSPQRSWVRSALLVSQAALSLVLLIGATLFLRSLRNVNALELGYDVERTAYVQIPLQAATRAEGTDLAALLSSTAVRLREVPGVATAAVAAAAPMRGASVTTVLMANGDSLPSTLRAGDFNSVSPEFFEAAGTEILEGRAFLADEVEALIVNQTLAAGLWPGESAVGKCLRLREPENPCFPIVGVSANPRRMELIEEPTPYFFTPIAWRPNAARALILRVDPAQWPAILSAVQAQLDPIFGPRTLRSALMSEDLTTQLRPWRLGAQLFTAFGLLALLVTLVGIYSVTSYSVSQRVHEMGVRIALGARIRDVITLVLGEGAAVLGVGVVVGVGLALALGSLLTLASLRRHAPRSARHGDRRGAPADGRARRVRRARVEGRQG